LRFIFNVLLYCFAFDSIFVNVRLYILFISHFICSCWFQIYSYSPLLWFQVRIAILLRRILYTNFLLNGCIWFNFSLHFNIIGVDVGFINNFRILCYFLIIFNNNFALFQYIALWINFTSVFA
jgi:hypothetical protein